MSWSSKRAALYHFRRIFLSCIPALSLGPPDDELRPMRTVGDLCQHIGTRLVDAERITATRHFDVALWSRYLDIVERETGVLQDRLRPEAEFYRELGVGWLRLARRVSAMNQLATRTRARRS